LTIFSHFSRPITTTLHEAAIGIVPEAMILSTPDETLEDALIEQDAVVITVRLDATEAVAVI
jgi:hypothetical protein